MTAALILLILTLAMLAWFAKNDVAEYERFKALKTSRERQLRYLIWVGKQLAYFALPAVLGLALIRRLDTLVTLPPEFAGLAKMLPSLSESGGDVPLLSDMAMGALIGAAIGGSILGIIIARRKGQAPKTVGDIEHLLPRNRAELACGVVLSVSAGVTEELMFRLFLPLLIVLVTGSAIAAFVVPVVIFGLMHRYQGWVGVVATGVIGAVFVAFYLATQSLWAAMLAHVVVDLNGLVLRPALTGALKRAAD